MFNGPNSIVQMMLKYVDDNSPLHSLDRRNRMKRMYNVRSYMLIYTVIY